MTTRVHPYVAGGYRQKGLDNMKQISTGAGLLGLGVCMVATAFIASQRGGSEAFAQGTGTERRIVSASVFPMRTPYNGQDVLVSTRLWSDNGLDAKVVGYPYVDTGDNPFRVSWRLPTGNGALGPSSWQTIDNGTSGFRPLTDVDMSGEVDGGDISMVLLDMNTTSEDFPPPPIDCNINAPQ
jgi:hypothetical protein